MTRAHAHFTHSLEMLRARDNRISSVLRGLLGLATWAAAVGLAEASARLRGFVFSRREALKLMYDSGDAADEADHDHLAAAVRADLGEAGFETAQSEGRAFTFDEAINYALALRLPTTVHPLETNPPPPTHDLTGREREIVALIARGLSNGDIADTLVLSKRTVEKHVANILSRLALTSRAQIVRWAVDHGLAG